MNEYIHPCEALRDGKLVLLEALEGREEVVIDGVTYEAFNTSGKSIHSRSPLLLLRLLLPRSLARLLTAPSFIPHAGGVGTLCHSFLGKGVKKCVPCASVP